MIKYLFIILFCFSNNVLAYQYFYHDSKSLILSDERFRRYVRPQVKNIVTEYYHLLKKINPLQGQVIRIKNRIREVKYQWDELSGKCLKEKKDCTGDLELIYKRFRLLEKDILIFEKESLVFKTKDSFAKTTYKLDRLLNLKKNLNELSTINYENLHIIEELLIGHNTPMLDISDGNYKSMKANLAKILITSELMISGQMDHNNKNVFYFLFASFIKPLEQQIMRDRNKKFFLQRLGELNIAWNTFHMKMVKGHNKLPKNLRQIIIVMHNRWNSLLKLLLKR